MDYFKECMLQIDSIFYRPNQFVVKNLAEEVQNREYAGGVFQLNQLSIRFRVAKITPTKIGQFVAFWEKDPLNKNQAFHEMESPDLLVVTTFLGERIGQFVFPKGVLIEQHILRTDSQKGKMAMRVYPSWDSPTSKQAQVTQKWQLDYFVEFTDNRDSFKVRLEALYGR
ncbi:MepB family protein [Carnobacterium divergens]|uniref:MepB family protein n=1 Tax=Carnobacterium divergens TaxID=2748 RepID=UPI001071B60A|nr:MepB family protein [Carnobacterium divergens]MDT1996237.1 MepB family protein [Carnobacterium divergens]